MVCLSFRHGADDTSKDLPMDIGLLLTQSDSWANRVVAGKFDSRLSLRSVLFLSRNMHETTQIFSNVYADYLQIQDRVTELFWSSLKTDPESSLRSVSE